VRLKTTNNNIKQTQNNTQRQSKSQFRVKRFKLDYAAAQTIKNNYKSFGRETLKTARVLKKENLLENKNDDNKITEIPNILNQPLTKTLMLKYKLDETQMETTIQKFLLLHKITRYAQTHKIHERVKSMPAAQNLQQKPGTALSNLNEKTIKRLLTITNIAPEEILEYFSRSDYEKLVISPMVLRMNIKTLDRIPANIFERLLKSIDIIIESEQINNISLDNFCRTIYYFVDLKADIKEYIKFGLKFIDPMQNNSANIEETTKLIRGFSIKSEDDQRGEVLVKALMSNFVLCGIFDEKTQKFNGKMFEKVFTEGRMSIFNFVKILFC